MIVHGIECPKCRDRIFSRTTHDFHSCTCGEISVDGGFDYLRFLWSSGERPKQLEIEVTATESELYNDWNYRDDKFGVIPIER